MSAVGYAVMPVVPVFDGITREINAKIGTPLEKASKKAGESIEKGVGSGVDAAADRVEKANYRVKKSSEELADAESKRSAAMSNSKAAAIDLATAEQKLADLKKDGSTTAEQLAKAEADLERKRAKAETAAQNVEKAERGVEKAMAESAQASKSLEKAQNDLEAAQNGSADATRDLNKAMDEGESAGNRFELSLTKITVAATAIIGAVGAAGKAAFELGSQFDDAYDTIRIGTGASGAAFEELQQSMRNVARDSIGVGSDLGEIGTTLADLNTRLGITGEPLEQLTAQFQQLKGMGMETDINAVTGAFTQFGIEVEEMPGMMDTLFQISQATGRSMNDLVGNLSKSGPALQEFGFGLEESAGLLGALDKAGLDADKTMMSMTKALGEFAKDGEDPQEALWGTIRGIDELIKAGNEVEAIDLANSIFGAKGGAGFVAAVESGQFAYDDFMESLGASADTINGLAEETADFAEKWDQFKVRAMLALEPVAMAIFDMMVPALETAATFIEKAITKFQELGQWVQQNSAWLAPLAVVVGTFAGSIVAVQGAILGAHQAVLGVKKAIDLAAGSVKLLMAAMAANPITLIIASIAALVAGLTYFFTQTEKGRELWTKFTDTMKLAWESTQAVLTAGFEIVKAAFASLGDFIQGVWESGIKPVFDWFGAAATWLWESAIQPVFGWIVQKWNELGLALQAGFVFIESAVLQPLAAGFTWLHDSVVAPVVGWIGEKWAQLGDGMNAVKGFIVDTVFGGLKSGLDAVQNWFNSIVDAIGSKWNELRGHLAKPINFMINTVYNDGILRAWNVIAGILPGLNKGDRLAGIPGYATGGRIKGPGTGTSDDILAWLSNGEHVWTAREVQAIGGHNVLDALRDAILHRRGFTFDGAHATLLPGRVDNRVGDLAGAAPDLLPRFARGGRVDDSKIRPLWELQLMKAHEFAKAQHGKPYQWAGPTGPGTSFDCSGFMGAIAATIQGTDPWRRYWATMSFPSPGAQGFVPGLGAGFSVGMFNGGPWGGHTAGTLSAVGPYSAVNVESGGSPSMVKYGVGAVGADDRQFTMHYHLPIGADGGFVSGGTGGVDPEVMRSRIAETLHKAINVVMDPIKGQLPAPPPAWLGIPGGVFDAGRDGLVGFVDNGVKALGDGLGTVFTAVSEGAESLVDRGRDAVGAAMNFLGARVFDRGGVLRKGQMAVNLGNADEHVISEKSFQNFSFGASVLGVAAQEILEAFRGGDFGYGALAEVLRDEEWAKAIVDGAAKLSAIADYNSVEGVAARSFATEMAGIAGMLGGETISAVTTSLLDAEREIWDARTASADRLADIAEKEKALEEARRAAADAASAEVSEEARKRITDAEEALNKAREDGDAEKVAEAEKKLADVRREASEKSAEDVTKANEQVAKAEQELAAARKASARALDIRIFDVAPQISGMLSQAAAATVAVPAVSNALAGLAAAAGPAGVTVGVALQAVKTAIGVVKKVGSAIGDFVGRIFDARAKTYSNMVTVLNLQHEWAQMVDEQAAKVVELRVAWVEAQVALRDATWKTRLAQADVVRAQLQGVKSVAEAEAKLEAERKRVAKAALGHFDDLSLAYDRYRWAEYQGMVERLGVQAAVTPEILALEAEVNVAKLNALAAQKEASLSALQASWEQQKAALALMQTQQQLALQTQQLAVMQREFFGMSQADSLQAMNTMKLRQELAEVQAQQGKNFWRLSYWLTGAHRADNQRERELKAQIAQREGSGAGVNVGGTGGLMSFFGYGDSALNAAKNAGYGKAERAMFEAQEQQALLQIEQQKQQLQQQIEQSKLFEQYQQQVGALTAEIESLKTGASAAQYTADYYREENPAVKAANLALARFEAERSSQYAAVGRGEKQVVEITIPEQDVYTREQMELVLRSVQEIPELEARIRKVEAPATPGANVAMRSMIGG